jgi:PAS domain S-box-containing protein
MSVSSKMMMQSQNTEGVAPNSRLKENASERLATSPAGNSTQDEEAARESEPPFRRMADAAPVLIWVSDTTKACTWFNKWWVDFTGRSIEQLANNGWADDVHPDDLDHCLHIYTCNFDARKPFSMDYRLRRHDGEYRWVLDHGLPRFDSDGKFAGYVGSCIDITERHEIEEKLRESEERFRMMADNISQLAWTCDQLGDVTWYNQRWLDYTGLSFDEMKDWGWTKYHHPDHIERVVKSVRRSRETGEVWEDTFPLRGKDGEYRWFLSRAVPIRDAHGNILRWFGTNTDVTEQRAAEQALRQSHEMLTNQSAHLEALVQERTAKLQETIAELEHFSYTITHDMRGPLRAMQVFGRMIQEDSGNRLSASSADYLRRIMNSARRMDALILDSLQYAKTVRESLPIEAVQPAPILRGILESYPTLQPPNVQIEIVDPLPSIMANEAGLAQCFSNLLVNAIKFIKPGVTPAIRVWAAAAPAALPASGENGTPPSAKFIRLWFEDNGIGISEEYHGRIFGMFQQLDKKYDGTGIGLALVQKTAERMGGKVGVESELGKGSRFWLEFKAAPVLETK